MLHLQVERTRGQAFEAGSIPVPRLFDNKGKRRNVNRNRKGRPGKKRQPCLPPSSANRDGEARICSGTETGVRGAQRGESGWQLRRSEPEGIADVLQQQHQEQASFIFLVEVV